MFVLIMGKMEKNSGNARDGIKENSKKLEVNIQINITTKIRDMQANIR